MSEQVTIRTLAEALAWGDSWRAAYWELERAWRMEYLNMEMRARLAEMRVVLLESESNLADGGSVKAAAAAKADLVDRRG